VAVVCAFVVPLRQKQSSDSPLRSGRSLAKGERFLRTPGTRAYLTNPPRQGRRTTKDTARQMEFPILPGIFGYPRLSMLLLGTFVEVALLLIVLWIYE